VVLENRLVERAGGLAPVPVTSSMQVSTIDAMSSLPSTRYQKFA
jgi:hypothetical protein